MIEKNEIANVWCIEDNKLVNKNKVISKVTYNGVEIAVLKSKREWVHSDLLIKDKDNVYWELGIAPIKFEKFISVIIDDTIPKTKEYCDDVTNAYKKMDFEKFFISKIEKNKYFNLCELKYISKNYTDLYDKAKTSRENFLQEKERERQEERQKIEKAENEEMDIVNEIFESKIAEMKTKIHLGDVVASKNYDYYKERNYYGGKVTQNNFLYLANYYGIEIPLATKGFINNRLISYSFGTGVYYINKKINNKGSIKLRECFEKIKDKVDEEYQRNKKQTKDKVKNKGVLGGDK